MHAPAVSPPPLPSRKTCHSHRLDSDCTEDTRNTDCSACVCSGTRDTTTHVVTDASSVSDRPPLVAALRAGTRRGTAARMRQPSQDRPRTQSPSRKISNCHRVDSDYTKDTCNRDFWRASTRTPYAALSLELYVVASSSSRSLCPQLRRGSASGCAVRTRPHTISVRFSKLGSRVKRTPSTRHQSLSGVLRDECGRPLELEVTKHLAAEGSESKIYQKVFT